MTATCKSAIAQSINQSINQSVSLNRDLSYVPYTRGESDSLHEDLLSQNTAGKSRSLTRSSFFLSEPMQKCPTRLQYVRYGNMAVFCILSFALIGDQVSFYHCMIKESQ